MVVTQETGISNDEYHTSATDPLGQTLHTMLVPKCFVFQADGVFVLEVSSDVVGRLNTDHVLLELFLFSVTEQESPSVQIIRSTGSCLKSVFLPADAM